MSGHLRFCFAAFLLLAGLSTSPASSNPFAAFLGQAAPVEATAPDPAEKECLSQPGKSAAEGQHWVYRFEGHRKCWFQAAEGIPMAKKSVHHHAAKHVAAPKENAATPRKRKAVVDARAELLRSAPAGTPQPAPPAPALKVVDASPVPATGAAALVPPPAPDIAKPATDQLAPENPTPRHVDVETLLAAAPASSDAVAASVPPATPVAIPIAEAGDEVPGWTATWLGVLLMALGFVFLLSSSRTLRGAVLAV